MSKQCSPPPGQPPECSRQYTYSTLIPGHTDPPPIEALTTTRTTGLLITKIEYEIESKKGLFSPPKWNQHPLAGSFKSLTYSMMPFWLRLSSFYNYLINSISQKLFVYTHEYGKLIGNCFNTRHPSQRQCVWGLCHMRTCRGGRHTPLEKNHHVAKFRKGPM